MTRVGTDALNARRTLSADGTDVAYYSLKAAAEAHGDISRLPYSLKVLLENMLRHEDGRTVTPADIKAVVEWQKTKTSAQEIAYRPARVLMQDFTGVPAVVDLASMRAAMQGMGGDPKKINPLVPVDLVIDHSVMVDKFGTAAAFKENVDIEMQRNRERYAFLRWGQKAFDNFRVVPPGTGICHQVNLENLAQVVWTSPDADGRAVAYPDTCVGTDSHTTMINGLAVLGWGVGGIEAEAAMLGQPISMLIPEVVGFKLTGKLPEGTTATDLVLTVTQMLRAKGVVGKFVEFYGAGLGTMSLADRATIANMAPEYGATCGFFPIDDETLAYMRLTGRAESRIALVEAYAKEQGLWRDDRVEPVFTDTLHLDMSTVEPSLAGPKRPQDRVALTDLASEFETALAGDFGKTGEMNTRVPAPGADFDVGHGDVVIAAITSCTNTSNPSVLMAAGLLARKARAKGLGVKPWVKTSLAPGSQVVTEYLNKTGLSTDLDALGFQTVGYGCTTCIGNSGPLPDPVAGAVATGDLVVSSVLSGNRNFEGRVHPQVKANYLASPPLVVAYALAGSTRIDLKTQPLGTAADDTPVMLADIWPTAKEIADMVAEVDAAMFKARYADVFTGDAAWQAIPVAEGEVYTWDPASTYVQHPPFFQDLGDGVGTAQDIVGAKLLAMLADSVTTDHISPAGSFKPDTPAGQYLVDKGVQPADFNSYGARRGNHEVMMRGTFANIRIRNALAPGTEGGYSTYAGTVMPMYDAAMRHMADGTPLLVIAGKEYGTGSSRDWAAKGTRLLGVKAVIAESFERIHRSNLVGMGVLPLEFKNGDSRGTLGLDGTETFDLTGIAAGLAPHMDVHLTATKADGAVVKTTLLCRIDTAEEVDYYLNGGILQYVLRHLKAA